MSEEQASASALQAGSLPTSGVAAGGSPIGGGTVGEKDQTALLVGLLQQSLQQNQQMMQQNQQLVATMLRRMDLEEERRNKAEEKLFLRAGPPTQITTLLIELAILKFGSDLVARKPHTVHFRV